MKLQLALDTMELDEAIAFGKKLDEFVDIYEIGTPLVLREGVHAVRGFRDAFPDKLILADTKIMDGGYFESEMMFKAGADFVTVLGLADPSTIEGCVMAAKEFGKQSVVDLLCVEDLAAHAERLNALGADILAVHTGSDQQARGRSPLGDLEILRSALPDAAIAVAGGITPTTINSYVDLAPEIIICGSAICFSEDPRAVAEAISAPLRAETTSAQ